jgi:hypothetical protein
MNRNEKRVLEALKQGYRIHNVGGRYWLKKTVFIPIWQAWDNCFHTVETTHTLSGVSANTVSWLHNHRYIEYIMKPWTFYYELA